MATEKDVLAAARNVARAEAEYVAAKAAAEVAWTAASAARKACDAAADAARTARDEFYTLIQAGINEG